MAQPTAYVPSSAQDAKASQSVSHQLKQFFDLIGGVVILMRRRETPQMPEPLRTSHVQLAAEGLAAAHHVWRQLAQINAQAQSQPLYPAERGVIANLVKYLGRVENLIAMPWPEPNGAVFDHLSGVFAQMTATLASWLAVDPMPVAGWSLFNLTFEEAQARVRRALQRWTEAIRCNRGNTVGPFEEGLLRAVDLDDLPAIVDRFDPLTLNDFLQAIFERVQWLSEANTVKCATFIDETASVFWDGAIAHHRCQQLVRQLVAKAGQEVLPILFKGVSEGECEILRVLPRVVRCFHLHIKESPVRAALESVLMGINEKHLKEWTKWATANKRFSKFLQSAHLQGLRAAITGEYRAVPNRYNLDSSGGIHPSHDSPMLCRPECQDGLPCTLEDINGACTGLRFVVHGGNPDSEPGGKNVWFTFGDPAKQNTYDVNHCTLRVPFATTGCAVLAVKCERTFPRGNDTVIGATIDGKESMSLREWADHLARHLLIPLQIQGNNS